MVDGQPFPPFHKQRTPGFSIHEVTGFIGRQGSQRGRFQEYTAESMHQTGVRPPKRAAPNNPSPRTYAVQF